MIRHGDLFDVLPTLEAEREADYIAIAERRIAAVAPLFAVDNPS